MTTVSFSASVWLSAPPQEVCLWHENPANLRTICPPWITIHSVEAAPRAQPGQEFFLHLSQCGVPLRWRGMWMTVDPPHCLEDMALVSPFAAWRHTHRFDPENHGTRMTDSVKCALPRSWGWLPGAAWAVKFILWLFFRSRHRATQRFFARQGR